jgi:hypothetical protein
VEHFHELAKLVGRFLEKLFLGWWRDLPGTHAKHHKKFISPNKENTPLVGVAGSGKINPTVKGGYNIQAIYQQDKVGSATDVSSEFGKRDLASATTGFKYCGQPVRPGLRLPGNCSGLARTLAQARISTSNAFMTGLLWFLTLIGGVVALMVTFKLMLKGLSKMRIVKTDCLAIFRTHYAGHITVAALRTASGFFFMIA